MLTAAARIAPRGVYVAGNTTSASGLTVTVVKDASGDFALEAGALVMGDQVRLLSARPSAQPSALPSVGPRHCPRLASLSVPLGASFIMTSQCLPNYPDDPDDPLLSVPLSWHCMLIRVRPLRAAAASTSSIR
jgi:hypothetical protein